jgi:hypothetical protein
LSTERLPQPALAGTPHTHRPDPTEERPCPRCGGEGWTTESRSYDPATGRFVLVEVLCGRCRGEGRTLVYVYPPFSERVRSAPCCSCGSRERVRDLVEVGPGNESLCLFEGDRVCVPCGRRLGVA